MPDAEELARIWMEDIEDIVREINFKLGAGKLISFYNQQGNLIKDPHSPRVYSLHKDHSETEYRWFIFNEYPFVTPFFSLGEENSKGRYIAFGKEKPFGIDRSTFCCIDKNSSSGVYIWNFVGESPNLKGILEKKLCWGKLGNED
jgi:hypothetical protein